MSEKNDILIEKLAGQFYAYVERLEQNTGYILEGMGKAFDVNNLTQEMYTSEEKQIYYIFLAYIFKILGRKHDEISSSLSMFFGIDLENADFLQLRAKLEAKIVEFSNKKLEEESLAKKVNFKICNEINKR